MLAGARHKGIDNKVWTCAASDAYLCGGGARARRGGCEGGFANGIGLAGTQTGARRLDIVRRVEMNDCRVENRGGGWGFHRCVRFGFDRIVIHGTFLRGIFVLAVDIVANAA